MMQENTKLLGCAVISMLVGAVSMAAFFRYVSPSAAPTNVVVTQPLHETYTSKKTVNAEAALKWHKKFVEQAYAVSNPLILKGNVGAVRGKHRAELLKLEEEAQILFEGGSSCINAARGLVAMFDFTFEPTMHPSEMATAELARGAYSVGESAGGCWVRELEGL